MTMYAYRSPQSGSMPLHRHVWAEGGQEMADFRSGLGSQDKRIFSAFQGESFGHRYVETKLGYETLVHGDDKSISQGLDGLYYDPKTQTTVVVEFKGQGSPESKLQKQHDWSATTCQKILKGNYPYGKTSEYERTMAKLVLERINRGDSVRYEVVRTQVDEAQGQVWTQLEKQTYLEQELTPEIGLEPKQELGYGFETPSFDQTWDTGMTM